ncbi:MAG: hypothetical protein KDC54_05775 [Lewinella sp.]|nr:hypothetical protein [Lewinella sp.]
MSQENIRQERERVFARHKVEDYHEAIVKLDVTVMGLVFLTAVMLISHLFGQDNFFFGAGSIALAIGVYLSKRRVNWAESRNILIAAGAYLLITGLEPLYLGFPEPVLPLSGEHVTARGGVVQLFNGVSPYIYWMIKVALVYPFIMLFIARRLVDALPDALRHSLEKEFSQRG